MKTLAIVLIASIALAPFDVSPAAASQNSAARDLAAAKLFAFGRVGAAGIMSEGERNLAQFCNTPMPHSSCKLRSLRRRRQASFTY